ncbi:MAG TPA: hypothetical protein ENI61_02935 [Ignavibacteria bacterium]|nr:hypothetical protein [Ignavibacteria bacterium]
MVPAKAIGAWQSKRGFIDIIFDKSVGTDSSGASFTIRDSASQSGSGVQMTQSLWSGESITNNTIRVAIPSSTPTSSSFMIDFTNIIDDSLNSSSGSVQVTLAIRSAKPYSFADLLQLQITDACVIGGDFEYYHYGIVRVFLNCPAIIDNSTISTQFSVYGSGSHSKEDNVNIITVSDAASIYLLSNDIKHKFNAHLVQYDVHTRNDLINTITSPDATSLASSIIILNEAQNKYLSHLKNTNFHIYEDSQNEFTNSPIDYGNSVLASSVAIQLKLKYNTNIKAEQFSIFRSTPDPDIGYVNTYSSINNSYAVSDSYTYFVDLIVSMFSAHSSLRIEAYIQSEDTFSFTSKNNFTGNFIARPYSDKALNLSVITNPDIGITARFTGNIVLSDNTILTILNKYDGEIKVCEISVSSTLPTLSLTINTLCIALNFHRNYAVHILVDNINVVYYGIYQVAIQGIIDKANELKHDLNNHVRNINGGYHIHPDPIWVNSIDATDILSLITLVAEIRKVYINHNEHGPHSIPSIISYNSIMFDVINIPIVDMIDGESYTLYGKIQNSYLSIPGNGEFGKSYLNYGTNHIHYSGDFGLSDIKINEQFVGLATKPSISSVLPRSGICYTENGESVMNTDIIEVYFSKSMNKVQLDSNNLIVTGGKILQKSCNWKNDDTVLMQVMNMESIQYSITSTGLKDKAGNPVY